MKLLILVLCKAGALEAARHAAFLFYEKCVTQVELIEVLEDAGEGRAVAFQSRAALRRREKRRLRSCAVRRDRESQFSGTWVTCLKVWTTWNRSSGEMS